MAPKEDTIYDVTYPRMDVMLPRPRGQTQACENITFPQLLLQAVIISLYNDHLTT